MERKRTRTYAHANTYICIKILLHTFAMRLICFRTEDCVNGTSLNKITIPEHYVNFTSFLNIYEESLQYPVDPENVYVPAQRSLTIYNNSRLYINLEGCVNTLKGECRDFLTSHGRDGDNQTAQSRYPCYYNKVSLFALKKFLFCYLFSFGSISFSSSPGETSNLSCWILVYFHSLWHYHREKATTIKKISISSLK